MTAGILYLLINMASGTFANEPKKHAIYITVIEIDHEKADIEANVNVKIFTDDLENGLTNYSGRATKLAQDLDLERNRKIIEQYLNKHIIGAIDRQKIMLSLSSWEIYKDVIWLNFSIKCPASWNSFKIKADLLMELFPTQTNVVQVTHGDEKRYLKLTIDKKEESITFTH